MALRAVRAVAMLTLQRPPINALDQEALDELARVIQTMRGTCFREE